jgi:hypothetical protein
MRDRIDLNKEKFHTIDPNKQSDTSDLAEYYQHIKLSKQEEERTIGLTIASSKNEYPAEIDTDDPKCYAKLYIYRGDDDTEIYRYFVKQDNIGYLFNPYGMYSENGELEKGNGVELRWRLRNVSPDCFLAYTLFLQTRNNIYFHQAERFNQS